MIDLNHFTREQKGTALLAGGIFVLLYAFKFFAQWLNIIVIIIGVVMVVAGFTKLDGVKKAKHMLKKYK